MHALWPVLSEKILKLVPLKAPNPISAGNPPHTILTDLAAPDLIAIFKGSTSKGRKEAGLWERGAYRATRSPVCFYRDNL